MDKYRIINGLYGQAVADAVGYPFEFKEFMSDKEILDYANNSKVLHITDDTQMALAGFEANVNGSYVDAYLDWYHTQEFDTSAIKVDGIFSFPVMYSRRAPGNTCLYSLQCLSEGLDVDNSSFGCGSVMRLLPTLMHASDAVAIESGFITHKHPFNEIAIRKYMSYARDIMDDRATDEIVVDNISELGEGWTAIECVDMAIWAFQHAADFDELLTLSINHAGDSDSVAAVAGSLWGLAGYKVPTKYVDKLDALSVIKYCIHNYIEPYDEVIQRVPKRS